MSLSLADKQSITAELITKVKASLSIVVAHYRQLTVEEMTELRNLCREKNVHIQVVRNTLAKRAIKDTDFDCIEPVLTGPTVLLFANDEPGAAARIVKDFAKKHANLIPQGVAIDGELLGAEKLDAVASLPTYDEAVSMLMSVMQAPVTKFVRTLQEPVSQVVRVISAVGDGKQAA